MGTTTLPEIRLRSKHQVTIPANIIKEAKLATDDRLDVQYSNGVILLIPQYKTHSSDYFDIQAFAGIRKGLWGGTSEDVDMYIRDLRA